MRRFQTTIFACALALAWSATLPASADVALPSVIGDNMVLQFGKEIPIWGTAAPGEKVTVKLGRKKASATACDAGKWMVKLKKMKPGGPHEMTVKGKNEISLSNILIGDVWVCSGQSNMQWTVSNSLNAKQEIASADNPNLRLFYVPRVVTVSPKADVDCAWTACTPATAANFSAVAYFFGREMQRNLGIPVGLIHTSWGGTPAESWTTRKMLASDPVMQPILKRWDDSVANFKKTADAFPEKVAQWQATCAANEAAGLPMPGAPTLPRDPRTSPHLASGLYNAMISPLLPYAIQGAIWYQGESNTSRAYQYRTLFSSMIQDWRNNWGQGDFPFLYVQLSNFKHNGFWGELREAQNMALNLPSVGMAVTIDIGNPTDIHPKNKQEVGRRLALAGLAIGHGKDLVYSGPMYDGIRWDGSRIRVLFRHAGGGLKSGDGKALGGFTIAEAGKDFVPANAVIDGESVIVSADGITKPVAVRYGWADNPVDCNLYNLEGLPASPFRTDDRPCLTQDAR